MREWEIDRLITEIHDLLYRLGVKPTMTGYLEVTCSVFLVMQRVNRSWFSIMAIYQRVAELYHADVDAIDPRIRHLIAKIWKRNPELLCMMAGRNLEKRPTPRQFINILCDYLSTSPLEEDRQRGQ